MSDVFGIIAIFGVILSYFLIGYFGYWIPIRRGLHEARLRNVSPHWFWFGIYPFVSWLVLHIIKKQPLALTCPKCNTPLGWRDRFCPGCQNALEANVVASLREVGSSPGSVRWASGTVDCTGCKAPVKLIATICTACGTPTPTIECPKCHSNQTSIKSYRTKNIWTGAAMVLGGFIPIDNATKPQAYGQISAITYGDLITILAGLSLAALGVWIIYRTFTWRNYSVWCGNCGKRCPPGPEPQLHPKQVSAP